MDRLDADIMAWLQAAGDPFPYADAARDVAGSHTRTTPSCCVPQAPRPEPAEARSAPAGGGRTDMAMASLEGGGFLMGSDSPESFPSDGEGPQRLARLPPFRIDRLATRVRDFAAFVMATNYVTDTERSGSSFVFEGNLVDGRVGDHAMVADAPWWRDVSGASWRHPAGGDQEAFSDYPVTHVAWNDAAAFVAWVGKRLPTEAEWEFAARRGLSGQTYPWGDELRPADRTMSNIWKGPFQARMITVFMARALPTPCRRMAMSSQHVGKRLGMVCRLVRHWLPPVRLPRQCTRPGKRCVQGLEGRLLSLPPVLLQSLSCRRTRPQHPVEQHRIHRISLRCRSRLRIKLLKAVSDKYPSNVRRPQP